MEWGDSPLLRHCLLLALRTSLGSQRPDLLRARSWHSRQAYRMIKYMLGMEQPSQSMQVREAIGEVGRDLASSGMIGSEHSLKGWVCQAVEGRAQEKS